MTDFDAPSARPWRTVEDSGTIVSPIGHLIGDLRDGRDARLAVAGVNVFEEACDLFAAITDVGMPDVAHNVICDPDSRNDFDCDCHQKVMNAKRKRVREAIQAFARSRSKHLVARPAAGSKADAQTANREERGGD